MNKLFALIFLLIQAVLYVSANVVAFPEMDVNAVKRSNEQFAKKIDQELEMGLSADVELLDGSFNQTAAPTEMPTLAPTLAPTVPVVAQKLVIQLTTTLNGITIDTYMEAFDQNNYVFELSIVAIVDGITTSNVIIISVQSSSVVRKLAQAVRSASFTPLVTSGVDIDYQIYIPNTAQTIYFNAEQASVEIQAQLEAAMTGGANSTFLAAIQELANVTTNGNTLLGVDGTSYTIQDISVSTLPRNKNELTDGQIAGLVIGIIFGVLILAIIAYNFLRGRRDYFSNKNQTEVALVDGREVIVTDGTNV